MKRTAITVAILSFLAVSFAQLATSQEAAKVSGTWDVTIRMSDQKVSEQWTILQDGDSMTATIKGEHGELKVPCELNGANFRSDFKDGSGMGNKVRASVLGDRMDGSLTINDKKEYLWSATRSKS